MRELDDMIREVAYDLAKAKEDWLRKACDDAHLSPKEMARLFMLEETTPELVDNVVKIKLRLIPRITP